MKLKDLIKEGLDPKAQKFLDAIQVIDRDIKDLKNITVDATPQGNWSVYFKGKRMGTINGKVLDDSTIMKYGLEESTIKSVNEVSDEAYLIHRFTSSGQDAAQNFIDDNNIDAKKLVKYLKPTDNEGMRNRYMVRDIIGGKTDNNTKQKFIKLFKESVNKSKLNEAEEVQLADLQPTQLKQVKTFEQLLGGRVDSIFDGIHGYVVDIKINGLHGAYRFDGDDLKKLLALKIRWVESDRDIISIGF
jgi:hypothetical protein